MWSLLSRPLVGLVVEPLLEVGPLRLRLLPQVQVHLGLALHLLQLVPDLSNDINSLITNLIIS